MPSAAPQGSIETAPRPTAVPAGAGDWAGLRAELDAWAAAGRAATLWWRDDDAVDATPALDRLLDRAARSGVPLGLAVIPAGATPTLAERLAGLASVAVLQHGLSHANHAPPGQKKAELGDHRPISAVLDDLDRGRRRLDTLFGPARRPVVPPWNRIGTDVAAALAGRGVAISVDGPRPGPDTRPFRVNIHADPIAWRGDRGFAGEAAVLGAVIGHLRARRTGAVPDPGEATGLLTHHLVHDAGTEAFLDRFLAETTGHPAVSWPPVADLFAGPAGTAP
ncbi:MAG: polysaccharide deacetylase family protein [Azospirillaceae bacterium]